MNTLAQTIGQRIRARRQELHYSQEYTAEKAGLHPTYIGQLERGEKNATIESISKVCIALELPLEDLFNKLIPMDSVGITDAQVCYELISTQPRKDQIKIRKLVEEIIQYKVE